MITPMLHRKGWTVNFKRIYRNFGGVRGYECGEKAKNADSAVLPAESAVAVQTKSIMFGRSTSFFDRTSNGRSLKILSMIYEYTGECIALEVNRRFTGEGLVDLSINGFAIQGVPAFIRGDNGPAFISPRVRNFLGRIEVGTSFISNLRFINEYPPSSI